MSSPTAACGRPGAYLGIPYPAPPVGERRWAPPARVERWAGQLNALAPGPPPVWGEIKRRAEEAGDLDVLVSMIRDGGYSILGA